MSILNFYDLRKQYDLPAADARVIFSDLGFRVENIDGEIKVDTRRSNLPSKYGVDVDYLIKHAVLEYRRLLSIENTLQGKFMEFDVEGEDIKGRVGVSTISEDQIRPVSPSLKIKPNTPTRQPIVRAAAPPAPVVAAPAPDALQLLAGALVEAQRASAPADPLLPQKQLLEAAQAGFHITSEQLGQLLGMSRSTIASKKSGFIKLGFRYEKIKEGNSTLWKVALQS